MAPPVGSPSGGPWVMVFEDHFDHPVSGKPDPAVWCDRYIYGDQFRVQNNTQELEWYAHGYYGHSVAGSVLSLTARFENPHTVDSACPVPMFNGNTGLYTSGVACSFPGFNFTYGYVEARIANTEPTTVGSWPAFWLLPYSQWPPEIDIDEWKSGGIVENYIDSGGTNHISNVAGDGSYHAYGLRLDSSNVTWFIDGVQQFQVPYTSGALAWHVILNHAMFSNTSGGPQFPLSFNADYVRAWVVQGVPAQPSIASVSPSNGIPGAGSATVSFGSVTGATSYRVTAFANDYLDDGGFNSAANYNTLNGSPEIAATGTSSPITVTGLTNGWHYSFSVAALNATGYSIESLPVPAPS